MKRVPICILKPDLVKYMQKYRTSEFVLCPMAWKAEDSEQTMPRSWILKLSITFLDMISEMFARERPF